MSHSSSGLQNNTGAGRGGMTRRGNASDADDRSFLPATAMSTSALESRLRKLREDSQKHSQILTQKLASSQSGQNLLHIGTSLSTLPPDLHSLLTHLHPFLSAAEQAEGENLKELTDIVQAAHKIRLEQRRVRQAFAAAELYSDLQAAESSVQRQKREHQQQPRNPSESASRPGLSEEDLDDEGAGELLLSFS